MNESAALRAAREHLARAEAAFKSASGLAELEQGLALLDALIADAATERTIANNLAATYATRIFGHVNAAVTLDRAVPQPTLEHFFKLMLAFDEGDFTLPDQARDLKIAVIRRLIDLAYEGHPAAEKHKALERLSEITGDRY
jgi:hypothetical protein